MEDNKNILLQKLPDWVSRVLRGLSVIVVPIPFLFVVYLIIVFSGFRGDVQGSDYSSFANIVCGGIYLVCVIVGIVMMRGSISSSAKHKIIVWTTVIISLGIVFFLVSA